MRAGPRVLLRALLAVLVAPALLVGSAGIGQAATTRLLPSSAQLRNAAGHTDGCRVWLPGPFQQVPQQGVMTIGLREHERCTWSARIHWLAVSVEVFQVLPDGTQVVVVPRGPSVELTAPPGHGRITDAGVGEFYLDCSAFGLSGRVTLVQNVKVRVRRLRLDHTTGFNAVVERQQTVSCS
jgi:hypothetical protein